MRTKDLGLFWMLVQIILTAVLTIVSKFAFDAGVEPLSFSWQVLLVSTGVLFIFGLFRERKVILGLNRKLLFDTMLVGLIGGGLAYALSFSGLKLSNAINYSFLAQSSIFFTALIAYIVLKEKISRRKWLLMVLLLVGVYLIATSGKQISVRSGDIFILLGSFAYSVAIIIAKKSLDKIPIITFSAYRALFGTLSLVVFLLMIGKFNFGSNWQWALLAGLIIAVGILAMNKVLVYAGASYLAMMSASIPVITAVLAYVVLGESISPIQILGAILIIISTVFIMRSYI